MSSLPVVLLMATPQDKELRTQLRLGCSYDRQTNSDLQSHVILSWLNTTVEIWKQGAGTGSHIWWWGINGNGPRATAINAATTSLLPIFQTHWEPHGPDHAGAQDPVHRVREAQAQGFDLRLDLGWHQAPTQLMQACRFQGGCGG